MGPEEVADSNDKRRLPPGFEIRQVGIEWRVYKDGEYTGEYALGPAKARDVVAKLCGEVKQSVKTSSAGKQPRADVESKTCPRCQVEAAGRAEIDSVFGFRLMNGTERPQSYCRPCRSSLNKAEKTEQSPVSSQKQPVQSPSSPPRTLEDEDLRFPAAKSTSAPVATLSKKAKSETEPARTEPLSDEADKAIRLFKFLRQLALMQSQRVLSLEKYADVLWFNDIEPPAGCTSVYNLPEDLRSDTILEIEQPKLVPPQNPPGNLTA